MLRLTLPLVFTAALTVFLWLVMSVCRLFPEPPNPFFSYSVTDCHGEDSWGYGRLILCEYSYPFRAVSLNLVVPAVYYSPQGDEILLPDMLRWFGRWTVCHIQPSFAWVRWDTEEYWVIAYFWRWHGMMSSVDFVMINYRERWS